MRFKSFLAGSLFVTCGVCCIIFMLNLSVPILTFVIAMTQFSLLVGGWVMISYGIYCFFCAFSD